MGKPNNRFRNCYYGKTTNNKGFKHAFFFEKNAIPKGNFHIKNAINFLWKFNSTGNSLSSQFSPMLLVFPWN